MVSLAYLAGFFDGEGNIRVARNARSFYLRISATQVDPAPLLMFREQFGGYVYDRPSRRNRDGHTRQPISDWVLHGPDAAAALRAMLPYLVVKRGAAQIGIDFQAIKRPDGGPGSRRRLTDWELAERLSYADALTVRGGHRSGATMPVPPVRV